MLVLIPAAKRTTPAITKRALFLLEGEADSVVRTKDFPGSGALAGLLRSRGFRSPTHSTHALPSRSKQVRHTSRPHHLHLNIDSFLTITPREQMEQNTWMPSCMPFSMVASFQYLAATGIRRPEPKAFPVTLRPGAACLRLYSLARTARNTHSTVFLLNPLLTMASGSLLSSI